MSVKSTLCALGAVLTFSPAVAARADVDSRGAGSADQDICQFIPAEGEVRSAPGFQAHMTADGQSHHFTAHLQTPTPGYGYSFGPMQIDEQGRAALDLKLIAPSGMSLQQIAGLDVETRLQLHGVDSVRIRIDRQFHWGPDYILCQLIRPAP